MNYRVFTNRARMRTKAAQFKLATRHDELPRREFERMRRVLKVRARMFEYVDTGGKDD